MPFVRRSRDKRGYEHIYLMHAHGRRGKPSKPRLLYWFRTPPGVKVGREPFDETVRRTLEAQYPGVVFDWKKLSFITVAPPDIEHWRERRRAERAAKQARRAEETAGPAASERDADEINEENEQPFEQHAEEPIEIAASDHTAFVEGTSDQDADDEEEIDRAPEIDADLDAVVDLVTTVETVDTSATDHSEPKSETVSASTSLGARPSPPLRAGPSSALGAGDQTEPRGRRRRRRGGRRRRKPVAVTNSTSAAQPIQVAEDSRGPAKNSTETSKSAEDSSKEE